MTLPPPSAAEVCRRFAPSAAALGLLSPGLGAADFFDALVSAGHLADARRVLAHALPPRRAVWWATLCLRHAAGKVPLPAAERDAFLAAAAWVVRPAESARRAAEDAGWAARPSSAAGILAMACFLSGGSISRPGLPGVFAAPHLSGRLCGVVVYLASVRFDPKNYLHHLRQYLAVGRDVAAGRNLPPGGPADVPAGPPLVDLPVVSPGRAGGRVGEFLAAAPLAAECRHGEPLFLAESGARA